jgi:hypothetical protein
VRGDGSLDYSVGVEVVKSSQAQEVFKIKVGVVKLVDEIECE